MPAFAERQPITQSRLGQNTVDVFMAQGALYAEIPGIPAGPDGTVEIPPRVVPFEGHLIPTSVAVREANTIHEGRIIKQTRYMIMFNGEEVYSPARSFRDAQEALAHATWALVALRNHPVRWWVASSWQGRPVWYQGVAAMITNFDPRSGQATLLADDGATFPLHGALLESGADPADASVVTLVDLLDPLVLWTRTRMPQESSPPPPAVESTSATTDPGEEPDE